MHKPVYNQFKYIIFDLDDTLVDTSKTIQRRLKSAVDSFSLEANVTYLYELVANPLRKELLAQNYEHSEIFWDEYERLRGIIYVNPMGNIRGIFDKLKAGGVKKGVLTNNTHNKALFKLRRCGINVTDLDGGFFNSDNLPFLKPDYRCFDFLSDKSSVVYIGDDLVDYTAARDAGIAFLGVTSGLTSGEQFVNAGLNNPYIFGDVNQIKFEND